MYGKRASDAGVDLSFGTVLLIIIIIIYKHVPSHGNHISNALFYSYTAVINTRNHRVQPKQGLNCESRLTTTAVLMRSLRSLPCT